MPGGVNELLLPERECQRLKASQVKLVEGRLVHLPKKSARNVDRHGKARYSFHRMIVRVERARLLAN